MNHLSILLLFIFTLSGLSGYASEIAAEANPDKYRKVIIHLEDGTQKMGYIKEFRLSRVVDYGYSLGNKTLENKFGYQTKNFVFKKNLDSKREKISIDEIKSMEFILNTDEEGVTENIIYEKVVLGKLNNKKKIKAEKVYTLLPVFFKNPKITIYAFNVNDYTNFYFKGSHNEYTLHHDVKWGDILKPRNYINRFYGIFEYMGENCPEYLKWLENSKSSVSPTLTGMKYKETPYYQIQSEYKSDVKDAKKNMSKEEYESYQEWRNKQRMRELVENDYEPYDELVMQYISSCD